MKNYIRAALTKAHLEPLAPPSRAGMPPKNKNQENNKAMEDTIESVLETLTEINDGISSRNAELQRLTAERETLILDASLNRNGALKALQTIDDKIEFRTRDVYIKRSAFAQVEIRLKKAREALAREQERQRVLEMSDFARQILEHAKQYSYNLTQAAISADHLKLTIRNMLNRADRQEAQWLTQLLEASPYQRAAEHSGLRRHLISIPPYPGPRSHVVSLSEAMAQLLARWLQAPEPEPNNNGNDGNNGYVVIENETEPQHEAESEKEQVN